VWTTAIPSIGDAERYLQQTLAIVTRLLGEFRRVFQAFGANDLGGHYLLAEPHASIAHALEYFAGSFAGAAPYQLGSVNNSCAIAN
jgi:hypothetical protein